MKSVVIHLLLLANICSGLAFAWDSHPEAMVGHDTITFDRVADGLHDHAVTGDLLHGNHCCHGAAHLVGMVRLEAEPAFPRAHAPSLLPVMNLPSLYIAPHLRPPIL